MANYIAYPYGKMNQSFAMKNEANESVYEANLIKFRLFSASDYEFVNKINVTRVQHKVGKTKTIENNVGGMSFSSTSYFKLDGVNVFNILDKQGCSFSIVFKADIFHPEFALVDSNENRIALYKMNVKGERQEGVKGIGNSQRNIAITTESEDLDLVFLGAFILSHVDFSAYLI